MSEASLFGQERWTARELAEALALSTQRVNQLVKEGILPPAVEGRYSPKIAVSGYIRHLEMKQEMSSKAGEEVRKLSLENEMRLIKLQKIASELVPRARLERDWAEFTGRVRVGLLDLPSRLSGVFAAENQQERIFDLFSLEINQTLVRLATRHPAVKSEPITACLPLEKCTDTAEPEPEPTGATFEAAFLDRGVDDTADRFSTGD